MKVFFSPKGGCEAAIVAAITAAKATIRVQAYSFTSKPIIAALSAAKARGIDVAVLLDKSWPVTAPSVPGTCAVAGIGCRIDDKHAIAHDKVMVIDAATVATGSFNFTEQAEHANAENVLIIKSRSLAAQYGTEWEGHWAHSVAAVMAQALPGTRLLTDFPRE